MAAYWTLIVDLKAVSILTVRSMDSKCSGWLNRECFRHDRIILDVWQEILTYPKQDPLQCRSQKSMHLLCCVSHALVADRRQVRSTMARKFLIESQIADY